MHHLTINYVHALHIIPKIDEGYRQRLLMLGADS